MASNNIYCHNSPALGVRTLGHGVHLLGLGVRRFSIKAWQVPVTLPAIRACSPCALISTAISILPQSLSVSTAFAPYCIPETLLALFFFFG
jgi:hypothetical protein